MTMINDARLYTAGEVLAGTVSKITPTPIHRTPGLADPLGGLVQPCHAGTSSSCLGPSSLPAKNMGTPGGGPCKSQLLVCLLSPPPSPGPLLPPTPSGTAPCLPP